MRQSQLFTKTLREAPKNEVSANAKLLIRAGFIDKVAAGIYTYLPLGLLVLRKIQNVIREEIKKLGAQEVLMPAMHPSELWLQTGRWNNPGGNVMFQFEGRDKKMYGLGWTHEEIITPLLKKYIKSYKDLPIAIFQIQDKFRNEPRAKSGLLRGREFSMKDMYSFHANEDDLNNFYDNAMKAYENIFKKLSVPAYTVEASGGSFSKLSHEFQALTPYGEDIIFVCDSCGKHQNKEITKSNKCPYCDSKRLEKKGIEVGNIFKLGRRFSDPFSLTFKDRDGRDKPVFMGCYGMGPSRILGTIVELNNDGDSIKWPSVVAPFKYHLVSLLDSVQNNKAEELYDRLIKGGKEVLYDDRSGLGHGEKLKDADLMGISTRIIVSEKTLKNGSAEINEINSGEVKIVKIGSFFNYVQ